MVSDVAWKIKEKTKTHLNTKFLHIFNDRNSDQKLGNLPLDFPSELCSDSD